MSNWTTEELENCLSAIIDYRGKTPVKTTSGIPLITAKIVKNGRIEKPNEFIAEKDYESWMTRGLPKKGDVILTTEAPLGEVAQINDERLALAQRIILLRGKKGVLDNTYLKYYLISPLGQSELTLRQSGTTVFGIRQSELRRIKIAFPSFPEQKAIAEVLSSFDNKIEINRRMNATLEEMARAVFKAWFVDFEPVRANMENRPSESALNIAHLFPSECENDIPKGWRIGRISDFCDVARGSSPRPIHDYIGEDIPWVKIADATSAESFFIFETKEKIKASGRDKSVFLSKGSLILSNSATCGVPMFLEVDGCIHDGWLFFSNYRGITPGYLFQALNRMTDRLIHEADGTVQKNLNIGLISKQQIIVPSPEVMAIFDEIHSSFLKKIKENIKESRNLSEIRDSLLPRLISGKIRVSKSESEVEVNTE